MDFREKLERLTVRGKVRKDLFGFLKTESYCNAGSFFDLSYTSNKTSFLNSTEEVRDKTFTRIRIDCVESCVEA